MANYQCPNCLDLITERHGPIGFCDTCEKARELGILDERKRCIYRANVLLAKLGTSVDADTRELLQVFVSAVQTGEGGSEVK